MLKILSLSVTVLVRSALLFAMIGIHGCAFFELDEELKVLDHAYSLKGKVRNTSPHNKELIVLLFKESSGSIQLVDAKLPEPTGNYAFIVLAGSYYVGAFEDYNNNLQYDIGEYIGFFGRPDTLTLNKIDPSERQPAWTWQIDFEVTGMAGLPDGFPEDVKFNAGHMSQSLFSTGTIASLDEEMFSLENAEKGYWRPLTFLNDVRAGVYFADKYDPQKIPILFIHGAVGTPRHFKSLVSHLDRSRFQDRKSVV